MTNEEINKWLSNLKDDIGKAQHQELWHYAEALDMAIEALSNSQKQSDSLIRTSADDVSEADVIYRQDAIYHCRKRLYQTAEVNRPIEVYMDIAENRIGEWLNELPSAQVDLSGYSDRLWKSAYDRGYARCRQDAIDAVVGLVSSMSVCISIDECHGMKRMQGMVVRALDELPSAQPEIIQCKDCYWWEKQEASSQGRCDRYGFYPTGYWYCAGARERKDNETD